MKKLALLLVLTFVLSLSCAFATEEAPLLIAPNPAATSGELSGEDTVTLPEEGTTDLSGEETKSGEVTEPTASGEQTPSDTDTTPNTPSTDTDNTNNDEVKSSNTSVVGAIIAIAIVIAVVVVAAIIRKD